MPSDSFAHPPNNRYFEDYVPGSVHEFGSAEVDENEVLAFGRRYVPLPYHVDKEAAKHSLYGGLIASGWQTAALMMRMYTENYLPKLPISAPPAETSCVGTSRFFPATCSRCAPRYWKRAAPGRDRTEASSAPISK